MLHLEDEEHILVLTIHHIISDAWSLEILIQELTALYESYCNRTASTLSPLTIQYQDFSREQRRYLQGAGMKEELNYWKQKLSAPLPELKLPYDFPGSGSQTRALRGARERLQLPEKLSADLAKLAQKQGSTLFMALLAAYYVVLSAYTGQDDIIVSTSVSNRKGAESESLIGLFLNTVLMRARFSRKSTFKELLAQVQGIALEGYSHQELPFEEVVKAILPDRKLNHAPISPVAFGLRNAPNALKRIANLEITPMEITAGTAKFDWELQLVRRSDGLHGFFEFNRDRFKHSTIQNVLRTYQWVLHEVTANPEISLGALMENVEKVAQIKASEGISKPARPAFNLVKPRPIPQAKVELVRVENLAGGPLPLVIVPRVDIDLGVWLRDNKKFVEEHLVQHGALLFRKFKISGEDVFQGIVSQSHELLGKVRWSGQRHAAR